MAEWLVFLFQQIAVCYPCVANGVCVLLLFLTILMYFLFRMWTAHWYMHCFHCHILPQSTIEDNLKQAEIKREQRLIEIKEKQRIREERAKRARERVSILCLPWLSLFLQVYTCAMLAFRRNLQKENRMFYYHYCVRPTFFKIQLILHRQNAVY